MTVFEIVGDMSVAGAFFKVEECRGEGIVFRTIVILGYQGVEFVRHRIFGFEPMVGEGHSHEAVQTDVPFLSSKLAAANYAQARQEQIGHCSERLSH